MLDRTQDAVRRILSECLGVPEPIVAIGHTIHFKWFGYEYAMDCQSPMWVNLGITLHDPWVPGGNPLQRVEMAGVPREEILEKLASLNGSFAHLRFGLVGERHVKIEWTGALFGRLVPLSEDDVDPLPPIYDLQTIPQDDVADVLGLVMLFLGTGLRAAFQAFGQEPPLPPRAFPMSQRTGRPDSLPLFRQAVQRDGYRYAEIEAPPPRILFLDAEDRVFTLILAGHQSGAYVLQMHYLETTRTDPNGGKINVIDGIVGRDLVEACNDVGDRFGSVKAFAFPRLGCVILATAGLLPVADPDKVALMLPVLAHVLIDQAKSLFAATGQRTLTMEQEIARRRDVNPALQWVCKKDLHPWETLSGRSLSEHLAPQVGSLFSGMVIPTAKGEVQVDHILVCQAGVFAIECKSHHGLIEGSRNGSWTHSVKGRRRDIEATWGGNPADQAVREVHAVRDYLTAHGKSPFVRGIVLFPDNARLALEGIPVNAILGTAPSAFTLEGFLEFINRPDRDRLRDITQDDVQAVTEILKRA